MKTYTEDDYEYGDLVVLVVDYYTVVKKGEIGIVKERHRTLANVRFPNCSGAFGYDQFVPLEVICKNSK